MSGSNSHTTLNTALATKTASTAKLPSNVVAATPRSLTCSDMSDFAGEVSVSPVLDKTSPSTKEHQKSLESCPFEEFSGETKKASPANTMASPLKPMVMTEKDRQKLMMKARAREEKRLKESSTSSSSGIGLANLQNWRQKLSNFSFSSADMKNLQPKGDAPEYKQEAFRWIYENRNSLLRDTEKTAKYYKLAFHDAHITVQLALAGLKEMIDHGLITREEFDRSVDVAKLQNASPSAQISVQSMSNLVKKLCRERMHGMKI